MAALIRLVAAERARHQIRLRRLDDQMVVISHQHPRMHQPARDVGRLAQGFEEKQPVPPVLGSWKIGSRRFPRAMTW